MQGGQRTPHSGPEKGCCTHSMVALGASEAVIPPPRRGPPCICTFLTVQKQKRGWKLFEEPSFPSKREKVSSHPSTAPSSIADGLILLGQQQFLIHVTEHRLSSGSRGGRNPSPPRQRKGNTHHITRSFASGQKHQGHGVQTGLLNSQLIFQGLVGPNQRKITGKSKHTACGCHHWSFKWTPAVNSFLHSSHFFRPTPEKTNRNPSP